MGNQELDAVLVLPMRWWLAKQVPLNTAVIEMDKAAYRAMPGLLDTLQLKIQSMPSQY